MMNPTASINETRVEAPANAASAFDAAAAATAMRAAEAQRTNPPRPPKLEGVFKFIQPLIETQPERLQNIMACKCKTMLDIEREIRRRVESRAELERDFEDKNDPVPETGKGKIKKFIPKNVREAIMPLNHSKLVKKDSRCATAYSEITTTLEKAKLAQETWKRSMADLAIEIADSEIKARTQIQFCEYSDTIIKMAEGFTIQGKFELKTSPQKLTIQQIAQAAIKEAMESFDHDHWKNLRFVASADPNVLQRFYSNFERFADINITKIHEEMEKEGDHHPDEALITWVTQKIEEFIPHLTTLIWTYDQECDDRKKLDGELSELYETKAVIDANNNLGDAMETDDGHSMASYVNKAMNRAIDSRISEKKKTARKNSSGDAEIQAPARTKNGQKSKTKSTRKKTQPRSKSSRKRGSEYSDEEASDDRSRPNRRPRNHKDRNRNRHEDQRGKPNRRNGRENRDGRPRSILRKRSVSWGRNTTPTPPRGRYSDNRTPARRRGTSYHSGRHDSYRHDDYQDDRDEPRNGRRRRGGRQN